MEDELIHEFAAGYALDSLSPEEERAYEEHLAQCERCREDLAAFAETALGLGFAAGSPAARPELRKRVMDAVHDERSKVVPLRPRWAYPAAAATAVAACVAIALGVWNVSLHSQLSGMQALRALPLTGATGSVVVARGGQAELVVSGLARPASGRTYEAWIIHGQKALPAGLFRPTSRGATVVRLREPVGAGARVGVTIEPSGGSPQPTSRPLLLSARA